MANFINQNYIVLDKLKTFRRKIQLVGGTTYSLSLPKEWVKAQRLKEQDEVHMTLSRDSSIRILPSEGANGSPEKILIQLDQHIKTIDQLILSAYYYGYETIEIASKNVIEQEQRRRIRKTMVNLSGTEIVTEDEQHIVIKVMLNKSKVNIMQTFYRIALIIEMSVEALVDDLDWQEIKLNEDEIDRLYHLIVKIISTALSDANILESSGIGQITTIPPLFLISKRLENIGDSIKRIARYKRDEGFTFSQEQKEVLFLIRDELKRTTTNMLNKGKKPFLPLDLEKIVAARAIIDSISHKAVQTLLAETLRHLQNIQDEVVTIGFYKYLEYQHD